MATLSASLRPDQFWMTMGGRSTTIEPRDPSDASQNAQLAGVGNTFEFVADVPRYRARLLDCFVTKYGHIDERVLEVTGLRHPGMEFTEVFARFWRERMSDRPLDHDTELFVAIFSDDVTRASDR